MKSRRRFTLLVATTALVLGSIAPPALAARPVKPPPSADLSLVIRGPGEWESVTLESEITYELYISNAGPSKASAGLDVSVSGGSVKSWTWGQGTCTSPSSLEVQCDLGVLLDGAMTKVTVLVKPNLESLATGVTLSGNVYGNQPDPNTTNNQYSESTHVTVMQAPSTPDLPMPDLPIGSLCSYVWPLCWSDGFN